MYRTKLQQMVRYAAMSLDLFSPVCWAPDDHFHGPRRHELENPQQEGGQRTRVCTRPCLGDGPGDTLCKRTNESLRTRTAYASILKSPSALIGQRFTSRGQGRGCVYLCACARALDGETVANILLPSHPPSERAYVRTHAH